MERQFVAMMLSHNVRCLYISDYFHNAMVIYSIRWRCFAIFMFNRETVYKVSVAQIEWFIVFISFLFGLIFPFRSIFCFCFVSVEEYFVFMCVWLFTFMLSKWNPLFFFFLLHLRPFLHFIFLLFFFRLFFLPIQNVERLFIAYSSAHQTNDRILFGIAVKRAATHSTRNERNTRSTKESQERLNR